MTRTRNARVAGFAFLFYIAAAATGMVLAGRAAGKGEVAAKLVSIAQHAPQMRLGIVLELLGCVSALVLAVTLYAITRDVDPDLALMVLVFRTVEGVIGVVGFSSMLGKLWLATAAGAAAPSPSAANVIGPILFELPGWSAILSATFFAIGSTFFTYLLVRGRLVPMALAWLGLAASILLVIALPLRLVGLIGSPMAELVWIPMAAFEVPLGLWLMIRGVRPARSVPR